MAHLEAEMARFEAEIAGSSATQLPPPPQLGSTGLPRPQYPPPAAPYAPSYPSAAAQQSYNMPQPMAQPQASYYAAPVAPAYAPQYGAAAVPMAAPAYAPAASASGSQAQQDALAGVKAALEKEAAEKKKKPPAVPRMAGGQKWWDPTLTEWPPNDFRIFVGDLGNEVNDDVLTKAFQKYTSFAKAKVVRNKHTNKSRGYGFVSLTDPIEGAKALKEMNGKYVGNRPCKLRKSNWDERTNEQAQNKKRKGGPDAKPQLNMKKHVGVLHR